MIQKICLWFYSSLTSQTEHFNHNICWIVPFTNQYLAFNKIFLYLYFILRLHKLFHRSAMAIPKRKLFIFAVTMIVILTVSIMYDTLSMFPFFEPYQFSISRIIVFSLSITMFRPFFMITISEIIWVNNNQSLVHFESITSLSNCANLLINYNVTWLQTFVWIAIGCQTLTEIFFYIFMLRLFLIRIVYLSLTQIQSTSVTLMKLAIKHTNLLILVMTTSYLGLLTWGFGIGTYMLSIDLMINSVAIYLSFEFSDKLYDILCCSSLCQNYKCHQCCIYLCWCCCTPTRVPQSVLSDLKQMESNLSNQSIGSSNSGHSNHVDIDKTTSNNITGGNGDSIFGTEETSIEIITNETTNTETSK